MSARVGVSLLAEEEELPMPFVPIVFINAYCAAAVLLPAVATYQTYQMQTYQMVQFWWGVRS